MFRVEKTLTESKGTHSEQQETCIKRLKEEERTGPRKGKTRAKWCCCRRFVRKASAFSPKIISLPATLDCLYFTTSCF